MLYIAHRGASAYEPENTLRAFRKALELGANAVELDVRLTKDRKIVVIHDSTLDRTTNASGKVSDFSLEEIRKLNAGKNERIPTLREALRFLRGKCTIIVEVKESGFEEELVREVKNVQNVIVSSFNPRIIRKIKKINKNIVTGFVFVNNVKKLPGFVKICKFTKADWIFPEYHAANRRFIEKMKSYNKNVAVWVVDSPRKIQKFKTMPVDGIISNKPDLLVKRHKPRIKFSFYRNIKFNLADLVVLIGLLVFFIFVFLIFF